MESGAGVRIGRFVRSRAAAVVALAVLVVVGTAAGARAEHKSREASSYKRSDRGRRESQRSVEVRRSQDSRWDARYQRPQRVDVRWTGSRCVAPRRVAPRYFAPPARRVVTWRETPYYWSVNLGVYLPEIWIDVAVGDFPPPGYLYVDRCCDLQFASLPEYRAHCGEHSHPMICDLVYVEDSIWYEPGWVVQWSGRCGGR